MPRVMSREVREIVTPVDDGGKCDVRLPATTVSAPTFLAPRASLTAFCINSALCSACEFLPSSSPIRLIAWLLAPLLPLELDFSELVVSCCTARTSRNTHGLAVTAARVAYIWCKLSGVAAPGLELSESSPPFCRMAATSSVMQKKGRGM